MKQELFFYFISILIIIINGIFIFKDEKVNPTKNGKLILLTIVVFGFIPVVNFVLGLRLTQLSILRFLK
jgi:hypothetical protein